MGQYFERVIDQSLSSINIQWSFIFSQIFKLEALLAVNFVDKSNMDFLMPDRYLHMKILTVPLSG